VSCPPSRFLFLDGTSSLRSPTRSRICPVGDSGTLSYCLRRLQETHQLPVLPVPFPNDVPFFSFSFASRSERFDLSQIGPITPLFCQRILLLGPPSSNPKNKNFFPTSRPLRFCIERRRFVRCESASFSDEGSAEPRIATSTFLSLEG